MTIDPRFGVYFSIVMAIVSALGVCGTEFTTIFGAVMSGKILAGIVVLNVINGAINAVLHMIPSKAGASAVFALGPKTADPIIPRAVPLILLTAFALSLFLASGPAMAQVRKPAVTGNIGADLKTDFASGATAKNEPALTGNIEKDAQTLWNKIQSLTKADLAYAIAKATAANTNGSAIRLQCLQAINAANDQANGATLKNADGTPMVRPDPALVTSIEDVAELVDNLSPQGKLFTSCAGAAQMLKTNTLALINGIVTGAAGIAMLPAGL